MSINLGTEANKVDKVMIGYLSQLGLSDKEFDTNFTISGKDRPDVAIKDKFGRYCIVFENKKDFKDLHNAKGQGLNYLQQLKNLNVLSDKILLIRTNMSTFHADEFEIVASEIVWKKDIKIDVLGDITIDLIKQYTFPEKKEETKLLSTDKQELKKTFDKINNYLRDKGLGMSERLHITSAMIFLKMIKENDDIFNLSKDQFLLQKLESKLENLKINTNEQNIIDVFLAVNDLYKGEFNFNVSEYENKNILAGLFKIIDETHLSGYDLDIKGEVFEYFINYGNTSSDMGEYFTPRHIVRFMVKLLDQTFQYNREKLFGKIFFDPTCGTGGFLIEIFKQIKNELKKANDLNEENEKILKQETVFGNELNLRSSEIAKMNMILTGDGHTNIRQGDFIAYKEEAKNKFSVTIGNPPFGNNREREFVDGFLKDVKPGGYSIFLVPEGVLFKSDKNFVEIRKTLVNKGKLLKVISLPVGSFLPYTGVKTDILFWKNEHQVQDYDIEFIEIKNDGYSLDMNRRELKTSDLIDYCQDKQKLVDNGQVWMVNSSQIYDQKKLNELELEKSKIELDEKELKKKVETIKKQIKAIESKEEKELKEKRLQELQKELTEKKEKSKKISDKLKGFDLSLVVGRYKLNKIVNTNIKYESFIDLVEYLPKSKRQANEGKETGRYPFFTSSDIQNKWIDDCDYQEECLVIGDGGTANINIAKEFSASSHNFIIKSISGKIINKYLYFLLKYNLSFLEAGFKGAGIKNIAKEYLNSIKVPISSLEYQQEIVKEIEEYKKIINGAKQIVETYKPKIEMKDERNFVEIKDIVEFDPQKNETKSLDQKTKISFVPMQIVKEHQKYFYPHEEKTIEEVYKGYTYFRNNDVLLAKITPCFENGKSGIAKNLTNGIGFGSTEYFVLRANEQVLPDWIYYFISNENFLKDGKTFMSGSAGQQRVSKEYVLNTKLPLPPISGQQSIIAELEKEQLLVDANKQLIEIFENKIKKRIQKIWEGK